MATKFKILVHRNSDSLHLKLMGDFDGTSANEVLNALKKNGFGASRVFIHTGCLKHVYPFDRQVFHNNLHRLNRQPFKLAFTGQNSGKLAPQGTVLY